MSPTPRRLRFRPSSVRWPLTYSVELTSGAPQKLFRYLLDSLQRFGLVPIERVEPRIVGQAIGDTGTAEGYVLGEKDLQKVLGPYVVATIAGVILILTGILVLPWAELVALDFLRNIGLMEMLLRMIPSIVLLVVGAALIRLHAFQSELVYVVLKGEVYRSGLAAGTRMPSEIANTQRLSIISELRLSVYGSDIRSKNVGNRRRIESSHASPRINADFQIILNDLSSSILPKVILQKTWEQTRHEVAVPLVDGHAVREVLVKCSYCEGVNPQGTSRCGSCGATLGPWVAAER